MGLQGAQLPGLLQVEEVGLGKGGGRVYDAVGLDGSSLEHVIHSCPPVSGFVTGCRK